MKHKEKMKWLKENDPITYYELNSNPTGVDSDGTFFCEFVVICIVAFGLYFLFNLIF